MLSSGRGMGADLTNERLFADMTPVHLVASRYIAGQEPDQWLARVEVGSVCADIWATTWARSGWRSTPAGR
jgi:hypothetical protein